MLLVPLTPLIEPTEAVSARSQPCGGSICINEVMPNPNGYDDAVWPNGEWLELHNSGTASVDVRNWYFSNKAAKTLTLDSNSIVGYDAANASTYTLAPGDYMIVARNGASNFYVANSNDFMTLYDSSSGRIDEAMELKFKWRESRRRPKRLQRSIPTSNPTQDYRILVRYRRPNLCSKRCHHP